ncbi:MAG: ChbG/HpnK family deacetylase [Lachnospiraceae bacterium]
MNPMIDIHADDYAVSVHASADILTLLQAGKLTSISVIPNMTCYQQCLKMLIAQPVRPLLSVHLNFMEGHCCSPQERVPELVDNNGYFKVSWGSLLKTSYLGKTSKNLKEQLKIEIQYQIECVREAQRLLLMPDILRIDSHQHTHMIPIVFQALLEVIEEQQYEVSFIRVAREPLTPFLRHAGLYPTYSVLNLIKNLILQIYAVRVNRELCKRQIKPTLLWGLMMSGHMDIDRMRILYPDMTAFCHKRGKSIEILFHPGTSLPEEITKEYVKEGFVKDHLAEGRQIEYRAVMQMEELVC